MNKKVGYLDSSIMVTMPIGGSFITKLVYRDYKVLVKGRILVTDHIPLPLKEFVAILGMDWLIAYQAYVDCMEKEVTLYTTEDERLCFMCEWRTLSSSIISALAATRMLRKGCEAYLAHVVSTEGDAANISDISIVSKFIDVLLEDLSRLPSFREMEFGTDLEQMPGLYSGHPIGWLQQN